MTLGEKIKQYREDNGLSQRDFAAQVGTSAAFVYEYERGYLKSARINTLKKLAALFCCTVEELAVECGQQRALLTKQEPKRRCKEDVGFFINNIEYLRQKNNLTKKNVETATVVPRTTYGRIIRKRLKYLQLRMVRDFSEFYNIPIDTLINEQLYPKDFFIHIQERSKKPKKRPSTGVTRRISANEAKTVGANIRRMREARHWSITSLAVRTGADGTDVKRWERGTMPTDEQLEAIIEEFGCEMEDLKAEVTK